MIGVVLFALGLTVGAIHMTRVKEHDARPLPAGITFLYALVMLFLGLASLIVLQNLGTFKGS